MPSVKTVNMFYITCTFLLKKFSFLHKIYRGSIASIILLNKSQLHMFHEKQNSEIFKENSWSIKYYELLYLICVDITQVLSHFISKSKGGIG